MQAASPNATTAATESPPPTTVVAGDAATASAIARVPAANGASSKTPIGPFQKTVDDAAIISANFFAVSGPMSRPRPLAPNGVSSIASAAVTSTSASAPNFDATTTSVGKTICTPSSSA